MQYCSSGKARFTTNKSKAKKFDCEPAVIEAQRLNKQGYQVFLEKIDAKT
jgi:hypothetical protein